MFKSLRYRILLWFFFLTTVLVVILFPLNILHENKKDAVKQNLNKFKEIQLMLLHDQIAIANFLSSEINHEKFFLTGESDYLNQHYLLSDSIQLILANITTNKNFQNPFISSYFDSITICYKQYNSLVDSVVYKTYERGFQNYGLIGELSAYIYQLEHFYKLDANVLHKLKLEANTYCLRGDIKSAKEVSKTGENLKNHSGNARVVVCEYLNSFRKLIQLDKELGLYSNSGFKNSYLTTGEELRKSIDDTYFAVEANQKAQLKRVNLYYGGIAFILILATLFFSVETSRFLVSNLEKLTQYISDLTANKFKANVKIDFRNSTSEIKAIYHEFRNMVALIKINEKMRDRALHKAEENLKKYRELADLLPISIYETDELGNLTYVNLAWQRTFGYVTDEIHNGLNLIEILNYDYNNNYIDNKINSSEYIAIRKDGSRFPATLFSDAITSNNIKRGHRGIIIDNTEKNQYIESLKKETIKAVTSDKHKSHFLANMSHELRTPMNSIIGFANLLSDEQLPNAQKKEFADHIQSSSDFLLKLIDDIIDIAKIEAGEIKIKKAACNPNLLTNNLVSNFEQVKRNQNKTIQFLKNIPEDDLSFFTDEFRLKQILTNLLSNAYKFTEEGNITVSLRKKNERMLEFAVEDTGIGMTREELNIIFERFKRTKTTEDKKISGTGLGLAISKNLVELLGGQMWVTSEKDKGTRFSFELPYVRVPKPLPKKETIESSRIFNQNWSGYKLLLAEDDDDNRKYIRQVLLKSNIQIVEAKNGREAIEAINFHDRIDIILMDLQMPVMNGFDAIRIIKKHFPIPIIVQTALVMENDREQAFNAGCDDYITKPLQMENFLAKINQFLSIKDNAPSLKTTATKQNQEQETKVKPS